MIIIFPDGRFGRWLHMLRLQQGLTPEQLAASVQCEATLLLQLEEGRTLELDGLLCRRLLKALAVPPDFLFPPDDI